jgi:hypothetical protein
MGETAGAADCDVGNGAASALQACSRSGILVSETATALASYLHCQPLSSQMSCSHPGTTKCNGARCLPCTGCAAVTKRSGVMVRGQVDQCHARCVGCSTAAVAALQRKPLTCDVGPVESEFCSAAVAFAASAVQAAAPDMGVSSTESSTAGGVLISAVAGVVTLTASMSSGVCSCTDGQFCISHRRRC